jgi:hypothetical protein
MNAQPKNRKDKMLEEAKSMLKIIQPGMQSDNPRVVAILSATCEHLQAKIKQLERTNVTTWR